MRRQRVGVAHAGAAKCRPHRLGRMVLREFEDAAKVASGPQFLLREEPVEEHLLVPEAALESLHEHHAGVRGVFAQSFVVGRVDDPASRCSANASGRRRARRRRYLQQRLSLPGRTDAVDAIARLVLEQSLLNIFGGDGVIAGADTFTTPTWSRSTGPAADFGETDQLF